VRKTGRTRLAIGAIDVRSLVTHETLSFELAAFHLGETDLTGGVRIARAGSDYEAVREDLLEAMQPGGLPAVIRLLDTHFSETPISIRSLFRDEQRRILHQLIIATLDEAESAFRQLHERYHPLMRFHKRLGVPIPKVLQTAAEFDVNQQVRRLAGEEPLHLVELQTRLREARDEGVAIDESTLIAFSEAIDRASERFHERPDDLDRLELLDGLMDIVWEANLTIDLRRAQNRHYRMRESLRPVIAASANNERWLELFDALGRKLNIAA
jgi:hypothetical protein